jgi:hypothetical protein
MTFELQNPKPQTPNPKSQIPNKPLVAGHRLGFGIWISR